MEKINELKIVLKEAFMIGIRLLVYTDYRQIILHSYFLVVFTLYMYLYCHRQRKAGWS